MSRHLKITFMSAFFLSLIVAIVLISANRPRILILHSYDPSYIWTRDINVGLERVLQSKSWVDIRYQYMDGKKHSSKDYRRRAGISARKVIENMAPDILIAIDDNAQKYAAKFYVDHPRIKIIFAGINGSIQPYGYDKAKNVTGILERKPVRALVELMQTISDSTGGNKHPRAVFLSDKSHSTERDARFMETENWAPALYKGRVAFATFEDWQTYVLTADKHTDFLLVGGYRHLRRSATDRSKVSSSEVAQWTEENSPIPVIGMNVFNTDDGIMASVGVSPYEQGTVAANMALALISNEKTIKDLKIQTSHNYIVSLSKKALKKRGIVLPQVFEAFARTTDNYLP